MHHIIISLLLLVISCAAAAAAAAAMLAFCMPFWCHRAAVKLMLLAAASWPTTSLQALSQLIFSQRLRWSTALQITRGQLRQAAAWQLPLLGCSRCIC
jgi:hypothetical protein